MKRTSLLQSVSPLIIGFVFVVALPAVAAPIPLVVKPNSISTPLRSTGTVQGGKAGEEFSLLGVQTAKTTTGEKLVLNYGDRFGQAIKGEPGYFQIGLDRAGQRITIDLSQVTTTGIEPDQLKKILKASKFVAATDMTMDPHDRSTNITLVLKEPVKMTVATDAGSKSKVILNLEPVR